MYFFSKEKKVSYYEEYFQNNEECEIYYISFNENKVKYYDHDILAGHYWAE